MISDLDNYTYSSDVRKINFEECRLFLDKTKFRMRHFKKNGGILKVCENVSLEGHAALFPGVTHLCSIGAFSYSHAKDLTYGVKIGRYCSIAKNVRIMGAHHFVDWISTSPSFYKEGFHDLDLDKVSQAERTRRKINIGNDVWIGADVVLKNELEIGNGAVIASNSVVTRNIEPYGVYGGVPARLIKMRFEDKVIDMIEKTQWWRYAPNGLAGLPANRPEEFLEKLNERIAKGAIAEFHPKTFGFAELTGKSQAT